MKTIAIIFAVLLSACVEFEPGQALDDTTPDDAIAEVAGIATTPEPIESVPPCPDAADCIDLVAIDAYYPPTRPDTGQPWDADGSLPEPTMEVRVNGQLVGATTLDPQFWFFEDFGTPGYDVWRARWREVIGQAQLHVDDVVRMDVIDDGGYAISDCQIRIRAAHLAQYTESNCLNANEHPVGSITIGIGAVP